MTFSKYQHIERWGNTEVRDIEIGVCHVFPKIDGTNASIWVDKLDIRCGSRKHEITPENDNHGFAAHVRDNRAFQNLLSDLPTWRLYGEWLVPHSLKTYREEAWRNFYVFDVTRPVDNDEGFDYVEYEQYQDVLETYNINYIPCIAVVRNGDYEKFLGYLKVNDFLMQDGCHGEGVVLKNYAYRNRYGRKTWAKIVTSEFKERNVKTMGAPEVEGKQMVEELIAKEFVTQALCEKVRAKIEVDKGDWSSKYIAQLLGTVFYDVVREETWTFVKKHKFPTVNFKTLRTFVNNEVKQQLPEVF